VRANYVATVMLAATGCVLVTVLLLSGSASARSCKPPPPIPRVAGTAIAGRVYEADGPPPLRDSCLARYGRPIARGVLVKLTTTSGRVIKTTATGAGGIYRFAVRPGRYAVSAYWAPFGSGPCETATVRVQRDERKILSLSCSIP
jgi:hypothetical protein